MTVALSRTGNLPWAFTTFVGRRREVADVCRLLGATRLLTLTGMAGIGKTRLALEAAVASAESFPDGVWLVDLAPVREPSAVASAAATALGVPDQDPRPVMEQLAVRLAGRRALIVADNCEHLIDASGELIKGILSAAPEVRVLATSRQSLGIVGEHIHTVPPLLEQDAVELLRDRTTAVRPEFRITERTSGAVSRLCTDLDRVPLAIELAASRLRVLTVDQMLERLKDRFELLTSGSRTATPRQRTLRAAIEWSYELCSPAERLLWNRLSVFPESFTLEAAEGICTGDGLEAHEVLDLLDRLVAQSVVLPVESEGQARYRLLDTIREYGGARLAESGRAGCLRLRHRDYYVALAQRIASSWYGPGQVEALVLLRAEHSDLLTALDCPGDPQITLALAAALRYHWCLGGFLGEGCRRLEQALAAAPEPTPVRVEGLWVTAWATGQYGDYAACTRWLDEADELAERLAVPLASAHVRGLRGILALFQGRTLEALDRFEEAVALHRTRTDGSEVVPALVALANAQTVVRNPRAGETAAQALAVAEALGDRWGRAHAMWAHGANAFEQGELAAAIEWTRAALQLERGFNECTLTAVMIEHLAWMTAAAGDHEQAARQLGAAATLWRDLGTADFAPYPPLAAGHAQCEEDVVQALGRTAYERAVAVGAMADGPLQAIAVALDDDAAGAAPAPPPPSSEASRLTPREREVAALVAEGMSNRQIGTALKRSPRTVDGHIENILSKLGFGSRAQIAAWWARNQSAS
ncbi:LuxR C-terminal-related transcriptional regulator [Streptomyces sp. YKOK-I1]